MPWIHQPRDEDLIGLAWDRARDPETGRVDHILAIHAAHPAGLRAHLDLYTAVMRGTPSLPKVERELVAFVTSVLNGCHY